MHTEEQIEADARPGRAFPNGTSWEIWQFNVCMGGSYEERDHCVHDAEMETTGLGCPLIGVSLRAEKTPREWSARGCTERMTQAQYEAVERKREVAETRRHIEESHYPMFEL